MNTYKIGIVGQKGGVGKSTVSRLLGTEFARNEWDTLIADMDISQQTVGKWNLRRKQLGIEPELAVEPFATVSQAMRRDGKYEAMLFDNAPHATEATKDIARISDLVILPVGTSKDDLDPQIMLALELVDVGKVDPHKIAFVLSRVENRSASVQEARDYLGRTRIAFHVFKNVIKESRGYEVALNQGYSLTETAYPPLNEHAAAIAQEIFEYFNTLISNTESATTA